MSHLRILCPGCYAEQQSCWICDNHGQVEFWVPEDQLETFRYDACIVLETRSEALV